MASLDSSTHAHVILRDVKREFADNTGLHATNLEIHRGEFMSILGPSGCGKSTLLRCIAGLETPDSGVINLSGQDVFSSAGSLPVNKRNLSMVFQDLALWPHMSVEKNIEFPLTTRAAQTTMTAQERRKAVERCMEMVGISSKAKARPAELSGGQQQRVAIARALVSNPELLLMDEPLSALDVALRTQIRSELTQLARELKLTVIYVTHDQTEALAMSDRVVVMREGEIEQCADPARVYEKPATSFVAGFVGVMNTHSTLPHIRPENVSVYANRQQLEQLERPEQLEQLQEEKSVLPGQGNVLSAQVIDVQYMGERYNIRCEVEGANDSWLVYSRSRYNIGDEVLVVPHY